jgi:hypothetical protein
MQRAVQRIAELERRRAPFVHKAILLDWGSAQKNQEAQALASANGIEHVIWQAPDHEAFLLRHIEDCQQLRPPAGASMAALQRKWPNYRKGQTQIQLAQRIALSDIKKTCTVEPELRRFLLAIGMLAED